MNLSRIIDSDKYQIADLSWLTSGLLGRTTLDVGAEGVRQRNNIKPELEFQWGNGMEVEDAPAGGVRRNVSKPEDAGSLVMFARDRMNGGHTPRQVVASLVSRFGRDLVAKHKSAIANQLRLSGVAGCFVVDARGYDSCKDALKTASRSPYKRFIRWVWGCTCGTPHSLPVGDSGRICEESGGPGTMDGFLSAKRVSSSTGTRPHCPSSLLPLLAADLDDSEMDKTLIDMNDIMGVPGDVIASARSSAGSNVSKLRKAFLWDMSRRDKAARWIPVPACPSEHIVRSDGLVAPVDEKAPPALEMRSIPASGVGSVDVESVAPAPDVKIPAPQNDTFSSAIESAAVETPIEVDDGGASTDDSLGPLIGDLSNPRLDMSDSFEGMPDFDFDLEPPSPSDVDDVGIAPNLIV